MKLLLATNNPHKAEEFRSIMKDHEIVSAKDADISFHHEEVEDTFLGNSLGKARTLFEACRKPVIADDSGLVVPALGGAPGVYSARFGDDVFDHPLSQKERNQYLLDCMSETEDRRAFFVCTISLILDEYRFYIFQETFSGSIIHEERGKNGFGYDPIFYIPELKKTAAELDEYEKNRISHRAKAGKRTELLINSLNT